MIIIEGADNCGKSVLAKKLVKKFGVNLINSTGPPKNTEGLIERIEFSLKELREGKINLYDRYPLISEFIYGYVLRNKNLLINYKEKYLSEIHKIQPLLIYCRPPSIYIGNFGSRKQLKGIKQNIDKILFLYDLYIEKMYPYFKIIHYDYTFNRDKILFEKVQKWLKDFKWNRGIE